MRRTAKRFPSQFIEILESRQLLAANYFVATTGSDTASGSSTAPFRTIQRAANLVVAGDTVTVRAGNYAGFILGFNNPQNGTASAPITFKADAGATITSRNSTTADGIDIERSNYIIIDGFNITNDGSMTRSAIRSSGGGIGDVIRNNTVQMNAGDNYGIYTAFSQNLLVENNNVSGTNNAAMYIANSAVNPTVRGNAVHNTGAIGIHFNGDAGQGGTGIVTGALIENNIVYETGGTSGGAGINMDGIQNSRIQNNLLYNNHGKGISLYTVDASAGSKNNIIVNNTVIQASNATDYALVIKDGATGNTVYNNVLFSLSSMSGAFRISADSTSGFFSDYNIVTNRMSNDNGSSFKTLAQWQSATGQDAHSISSTPTAVFVNQPGNDYHLSATSPAIDFGTNLASPKQAPATDISGTARPSGARYDAGAYERTTADTTAPTITASSFVYTSSPNRITITFSENVSASLAAGDLVVRSVPGNAAVPVTAYAYNTTTNTATFTLGASLVNGNYRATLAASGVSDSAGNHPATDFVMDLFVLGGDANHDRKVDIVDLNILASNWQGTGKTFNQGDLNYDTKVDSADLAILAAQWQATLAPASAAQTASITLPPTRIATRVLV